MKVIKDNSNKEYKVKCKYCKSKIRYAVKEIKRGMMSRPYIECPVCEHIIWLKEK